MLSLEVPISFGNSAFQFSTDSTLTSYEKDWVFYLMSSLTGRDTCFLTATPGSDPPVSPPSSPAAQATLPSPQASFSVPAGPYVELSPTSAMNLAAIADFEHHRDEQRPIAEGGDDGAVVDILRQSDSSPTVPPGQVSLK